ncbi:hypothetical protein CRENBAI_008322 [Crenichthys baileyi]|uniref:Uncharacterized protein n=1 Tax=Crenichthys baileyi TaxID=28760 RepID=A0AAV9QVF5_9TELE
MLKMWRIQRVHILRGCLSDPEVGEGVLYRHGGMVQLNHVKGNKAAVPLLIPLRDPSSRRVFISTSQDWNKHRSQKITEPHHSEQTPPCVTATDLPEEVKTELLAQGDVDGACALSRQMTVQPCPKKHVPVVLALTFAHSPCAARTGPVKAGGLLYVLDHSRWTQQMRYAINQLLAKHHGQKDFVAKVDAEYAVVVQAASRDPNSLLHPTTKQHISRYVKHLAKMTNTSSSLNTSTEKLLETQQLWHHLTEGSETVDVPVVTIPPATVNPPSNKPLDAPLTVSEIEKIVKDIVQKQQDQQQPPAKKRTRNCLACGQPKSRFLGDGSRESLKLLSSTPQPQSRLGRNEKQERLRRNIPLGGCADSATGLKQGPNSPHIHTDGRKEEERGRRGENRDCDNCCK